MLRTRIILGHGVERLWISKIASFSKQTLRHVTRSETLTPTGYLAKMDFNSKILSLPHVAQLIFEYLDLECLRKCLLVCESWREFLERSKFYWFKLTEDQPGWKKIQTLIDFDTFVALSKSYESMDDPDWHSRFKKQAIHPIFCSIQMNDLDLFKKLKALYGDTLYQKNWDLRTHKLDCANPIGFSALLGHFEFVKYIFDKDEYNDMEVILDHRESQVSPLFYAADQGHTEIVKLLLNKSTLVYNADNLPCDVTPLHAACLNGHLEIVRLLLNKIEGDKNPRTDYGDTPLHWTAINGHDEIVKLLLRHIEGREFPKDWERRTPLHEAAKNGHTKVVELLLAKFRGDKNPRDKYGNTPLHHASEKGHIRIVRLILQSLINPIKNSTGKTPLDVAANEEIRNLFKNTMTTVSSPRRANTESTHKSKKRKK